MEATKHRTSWAFKILMAFVLASTLVFPYAAFAFEESHAAKQTEALEEYQSSELEDDGIASDAIDEPNESDEVEDASESGLEDFDHAGAMDLSSDEEIEAYLAENLPTDTVEKSDAVLLDAEYTASNEETLREAFGKSYLSGEAVVTIKVTADIQLEGTAPLFLLDDQQVTIESENGATITAGQNARHFLVNSANQASGEGYLLFKNIVLDGANSGGGIVFARSGATYYVNAAPNGDGVSSDGYGLTIVNSRASDGGAVQLLPNVKAELYNLQLADNGASNRGGAIFADEGAEVNLYRSTVTDNHAGVAGGGIYAGTPGNAWDNLVFSGKSSFEGNSATKGGAIYAKGSIAATASSFSDNTAAASGGAIYLEAAETIRAQLNECDDDGTPTNFTGNRAGENGGAVFAEVLDADGGVNVSVNHTAFVANSALGTMQSSRPAGNGGAIALYGDNAILRVVDCSEGGAPTAFTGNSAKANGGAVYVEGSSPDTSSAYLDLAAAEVSSNMAGGDGGGVYASGRQITVSTSEGCSMSRWSLIDSNSAGGSGGGIRIENTAVPGDEGSYSNYIGSFGTISHNTAEGDGGGISIFGGASASAAFYGVEVSDNTSNQGNGGGIAIEGDDVWVEATPSSGSCSGRFAAMNIIGNVAGKSGGGVYLKGTNDGSNSNSSVAVSGTGFSISSNSALAGDGGGLYAEADDVQFEFSAYRYDPIVISRFVDNQASGDGGGVRVIGNETTVVSPSDTEFLDNAALGKNGASGNGGGVAITGGEALFNASSHLLEESDDYRMTVGGNTAAHDGGGIYMDVDGAATFDLLNVTVVGNVAQNNGGGSFIQGSEGSFEAHGDRDPSNSNVLFSWIAGNEAREGSGGAAYIGGGVESVLLSTQMVYLNEAALDGGAVYVDSPRSGSTIVPSSVFVDDSTIGSNKAGGSGGAFYLADGDSADPDGYGHTFEARHSQITDNVALGGNGGALYLGAHSDLLALEGDPSDEQLTIASNSAAMNGGAVYAAEGLRDARINGAEMDGNKATLDGGALYFAGMADENDPAGEGQIEVVNSLFNGNVAGVNGGAIWLPYEHLSRLVIDDSSSPNETSFSNNMASRETESRLLKNSGDVAMHGEKVFTNRFSANPYAGSGTGGTSAIPFSYAYNNYDVSYRDVYVVTYDGNGATGGEVPVDRTSYAPGDAALVLGQGSLVRDGYAFKGWALSPDSEEPVGATVRIEDADVTLYAIWQANGDDPSDPKDPEDPRDPAGPEDPGDPGDSGDDGAAGAKGAAKGRGLATTGDPVSLAAALGALAIAAAAAGLLTRRRVRRD